MIGLGSNRLTIARRGGMSVTQAGRGGMEWLAGGRMPSWASPYSAQATAALKAQFPTQWPTIRDYGFSHPEIVSYMNAYAPEDAKIAYSLVEGIGTRWIRGGNNAPYINTGIIPTSFPLIAKTKIKFHNVSSENCFSGTYYNGDYSRGYGFGARSNATFLYVNGAYSSFSLSKDTEYVLEYGLTSTGWYVKKDGVTQSGNKDVSYILNRENYTIALFTASSNGRYTTQEESVAYIDIEVNGTTYKFVPFIRNNVLGMIDMVHGVYYPNSASTGTFTELIESPS